MFKEKEIRGRFEFKSMISCGDTHVLPHELRKVIPFQRLPSKTKITATIAPEIITTQVMSFAANNPPLKSLEKSVLGRAPACNLGFFFNSVGLMSI